MRQPTRDLVRRAAVGDRVYAENRSRAESRSRDTFFRSASLEVLVIFPSVGLSYFGDPVAHLGYFRDELVARRRWLEDRTYADIVALCQLLPALSAITAAVVGVILNLAAWFAIHTIFRGIAPVRGCGFAFDAPVLSNVDPWALAPSGAAALAIFRFNVGMIATVAGCSAAGRSAAPDWSPSVGLIATVRLGSFLATLSACRNSSVVGGRADQVRLF